MLRTFRVANHKSFRDEAELLLTPVYDKSRPVLPVAGIFGANASGKSNLLDALRWLQAAVVDSYQAWPPGFGVPRDPFRLDSTMTDRPSGFSVGLVLDDVPYVYGVEVDDQQIIGEWLYSYPHNRRRRIFDRSRREIQLGSTVPDYRARGPFLAKHTRDNALFMTVAAHNDLAEVGPVFRWFQTGLAFAMDDVGPVEDALTRRLLGDDRGRIVGLVRAADLGIADITVHQQADLPAETIERLTDAGRSVAGSEEIVYLPPGSGKSQVVAALAATAPLSAWRLVARPHGASSPVALFHHGGRGGVLGVAEQSSGTKMWLRLLLQALRVLDVGGVLVVDEVDASLHPHLASQLVRLFRDGDSNQYHAQLIFTSHDATLLDDEVLARDEIWFVEKDPEGGATSLYPLTDFHPRKNEDVEGRYLAGGYGAVPVTSQTAFREAMGSGLRAAA